MPLTPLGEWCARIPRRRLPIVLDCSFSDGMGANALQADARARPLKSVDAELNRIGGEGRAVLTASGPTQPAWESCRFGHGFLTFYLIEALQGSAEFGKETESACCVCSIMSAAALPMPQARSGTNSIRPSAALSMANIAGR